LWGWVLKAFLLDELVDEFAPRGEFPGGSAAFWIGSRDIDVDRVYVAWNPGQLEGTVGKQDSGAGTYVAYLGGIESTTRALLADSLRRERNLVVRFVEPSWRLHSWGVTERIAGILGVENPLPVKVLGREPDHKVMTFLPERDVPKVRESLFASGAGRYGMYSRCSFSSPGRGTFYGEKGSKPAVGESGKFEEVEEQKLEVRVPQEKLGSVVSALRQAHPYEEPVIEVYETTTGREIGEGRVGCMPSPAGAQAASKRIASDLGSQPVLSQGREQSTDVMIWDGDPAEGLHEASLSGVGLYVGPDSKGLGRIVALRSPFSILEFPKYCFLLAGARELIYMVRETSKREGWGVKTYLPTRSGGEGVRR
jgi:hypothetical protein